MENIGNYKYILILSETQDRNNPPKLWTNPKNYWGVLEKLFPAKAIRKAKEI